MARPMLEPPCKNWDRDLPGPNDAPGRLEVMGEPPNHVDEVYLELPRSESLWRGVNVWLGGVMLVLAIATIALLVKFNELLISLWWLSLYLLATFCLATTMGAGLIRLDVNSPLDQPIRFNRLRRKVYVYRFHYNWGRPFNNKLWYVKPEVYDWDDLRAEVFSIYVPTMAYNTGVHITVVKPGTNQVIDRFPLALDAYDGANYWAMARAFMQQGPNVLPRYDRPPRDWNNEDPELNLARRFAPKVKWPEAMDMESRTAP